MGRTAVRVVFASWMISAGLAAAAWAEVDELPFEVDTATRERAAEPRLLYDAVGLEAAVVMPPARQSAAAKVEALGEWNAAGHLPRKAGFVRPLPHPLEVDLSATTARTSGLSQRGLLEATAESGYTWVTRLEVADAYRLRLRLLVHEMPSDVELMVFNEQGESRAFGLELRDPNHELWTPAIGGPTVFLEVHSRDATAVSRFAITAFSEQFKLDRDGQPLADPLIQGEDTSCLVSSACVTSGDLTNIQLYRAAVAQLSFISGNEDLICSGSLLTDNDSSSFIPYLLTANHCFSTQAETSSLDAYWDYHPSSCGGAEPNIDNVPRSSGGTLLATSGNTDFTFVRLNNAPAGAHGRTYLGWTTTPPADGTSVHGLHHPQGAPQSYTRSTVDRSPSEECGDGPTSRFIYTQYEEGATFGGSSGSPITTSDLKVVGQLFLGCGPNAEQPCSSGSDDYDVYGAFSITKSSLGTWLDATDPGGNDTPCVDNATTLCLRNKRFKIQATYRTQAGETGSAKAVRLTEETGYLWFFNQSNIEVVFKLLDGCGLNSRYWVFIAGMTNVEVVTTVTDTAASGSGAVRTFTNPLFTVFAPIADTSAFATCP